MMSLSVDDRPDEKASLRPPPAFLPPRSTTTRIIFVKIVVRFVASNPSIQLHVPLLRRVRNIHLFYLHYPKDGKPLSSLERINIFMAKINLALDVTWILHLHFRLLSAQQIFGRGEENLPNNY